MEERPHRESGMHSTLTPFTCMNEAHDSDDEYTLTAFGDISLTADYEAPTPSAAKPSLRPKLRRPSVPSRRRRLPKDDAEEEGPVRSRQPLTFQIPSRSCHCSFPSHHFCLMSEDSRSLYPRRTISGLCCKRSRRNVTRCMARLLEDTATARVMHTAYKSPLMDTCPLYRLLPAEEGSGRRKQVSASSHTVPQARFRRSLKLAIETSALRLADRV